MDANTNTVLEGLMNYGEMSQKLHLYSENRSIRNKRALIEGLEYTSRDWDSELYDNEPARNSHESQLFDVSFRYDKSTNGFGDPITVTATADPNTIEVSLHLYSGVIGALSQKVYPAMITDGLRIEIDTCRPQKCLELWTAQGFTADDGGIVTSEIAKDSARFCIIQGDVSTATPVTYIDLHCEKNPGYDQNPTATNTPTQLALDSGSTAVKNGLSGAVNLMVGKPLWGYDNANPPVWQQLGVMLQKIQEVKCLSVYLYQVVLMVIKLVEDLEEEQAQLDDKIVVVLGRLTGEVLSLILLLAIYNLLLKRFNLHRVIFLLC